MPVAVFIAGLKDSDEFMSSMWVELVKLDNIEIKVAARTTVIAINKIVAIIGETALSLLTTSFIPAMTFRQYINIFYQQVMLICFYQLLRPKDWSLLLFSAMPLCMVSTNCNC